MSTLEVIAIIGVVLLVFAAAMRFTRGRDNFFCLKFYFFPYIKLQAWVRRSLVLGIICVAPWFFSSVHEITMVIPAILMFLFCVYVLIVFLVPLVIALIMVICELLLAIWNWMS